MIGFGFFARRICTVAVFSFAGACSSDGEAPKPGTWVVIPPGTFEMGSPSDEPGRDSDETRHTVTLTHRFEILSTEVSQDEFESVMGYNPSYFSACGGDCPVEMVSWNEAAAYCNALSEAAGLVSCYFCTGSGPDIDCYFDLRLGDPYTCPGYRLPTEAEWEYAARAGTTAGTYNGTCDEDHLMCEPDNPVLDSIAWSCGNSADTTHPVATKQPNAWGLFDMLGNVYERCTDHYADDYPAGPATDPWQSPASAGWPTHRGGSWQYEAQFARAAHRHWDAPFSRGANGGFRPARTLPP